MNRPTVIGRQFFGQIGCSTAGFHSHAVGTAVPRHSPYDRTGVVLYRAIRQSSTLRIKHAHLHRILMVIQAHESC